MLPDSKTGQKIVYLNAQAEAVLASLPCGANDALVFPMSGKKLFNIDPYWNKVRRRAVIPDVRIHDLRHSFASVPITRARVAFATVGKLLSHSLPETTERYIHLADDTMADAAQRVSGSLAGHLGIRTSPRAN